MPWYRIALLTVMLVLASSLGVLLLKRSEARAGAVPAPVVDTTVPRPAPTPEITRPSPPPVPETPAEPEPTKPVVVPPVQAPPVMPVPAQEPVKPATPATVVKPTPPSEPAGRPVTVGNLVTVPRVPTQRRTFLIAGVTPVYGRGGVRLRESFRGNTDTLMLVQLDPQANVVRTLSLPRDTLVRLRGGASAKLNSALPRLGPTGLVDAVRDLTGLRVDGYLLVSLGGVRDLTDAVGGVTLDVARDMHYDDDAGDLHIHIRAGRHHMDGETAEKFIRFRSDPRGDIARAERQQAYLRALVARLFTATGIVRLPALAEAVANNTRSSFSSEDYGHVLGMALRRPALETHLLPGRFGQVGNGSYWVVNPVAAGSTIGQFRH